MKWICEVVVKALIWDPFSISVHYNGRPSCSPCTVCSSALTPPQPDNHTSCVTAYPLLSPRLSGWRFKAHLKPLHCIFSLSFSVHWSHYYIHGDVCKCITMNQTENLAVQVKRSVRASQEYYNETIQSSALCLIYLDHNDGYIILYNKIIRLQSLPLCYFYISPRTSSEVLQVSDNSLVCLFAGEIIESISTCILLLRRYVWLQM